MRCSMLRTAAVAAIMFATLLTNMASAQTLTGVFSRKVHPTGTFDLPIDNAQLIGGSVTVEPRAIGVGHVIVFVFDNMPAVTSVGGATAIDSFGNPIGTVAAPTFTATEVQVGLANIPNNTRVTVSVTGINGAGSAQASIGFLRGDVNGSRVVDAIDVSSMKVRSGQAASSTNYVFDLNATGAVNAADIASVKSIVALSPGGLSLPPANQASLTVTKAGTGVGAVSGNGISCGATCSVALASGTAVMLTVTPNAGSDFTGWSGDCSGTGTTFSFTFSATSTCIATFAIQAVLSVAKTGTGSGTISGNGISCGATCSVPLPNNTAVMLTATPNVGSVFSGWSGTCTGMTSTFAFAFSGASTCTATFAIATFSVTPSAGANGSISPAAVQTIAYNTKAIFTVTPSVGYVTTVGGTCGGALAGNTYTTNFITANCTVSATFALSNLTVTPSAGTNGVITPSTPQSVASGTTRVFTVSPNANYTPTVTGTCGGTLVGLTYTTNAVTVNCTVVASFTRNSYSVTPSAGANGTISPSTVQSVLNGATKTFTVTPSGGYSAIMSGTCGGTLTGTSFVTNPITGNCSVIASFASTSPKYVSTTGSDTTGTGTLANPWKTIAKGISTMVSGETLIVKSGTYTGTTHFITGLPSGTASKYTTVSAETPFSVRIQSTGTLTVNDYQVNLAGNYIKVDGFIFDMSGTTNPAFVGAIAGNFNTLIRSIFKRGGDIDGFGGLLSVTGSDTLIEDVAGAGACRYCFAQGGANATTQRNIWRRVIGRFDYSNSTQAKATFATEGSNIVGNVKDHLYQNVIAIDGQNPGNLGGQEKMGGFYASSNTGNITLQGSMVLNEGVGSSGAFLRELSSLNNATHSVVWDLRNSLASAPGLVGGSADHLTIGGVVPGPAVDLITSATSSLLKPGVNPPNLVDNTPGAVVLKQYGTSGTRWGQLGYNQITTVDLWPWPYQDVIKSVFAESNNSPAGNSPAISNSTRGFAAPGNGVYGGPITLTSYIWEYLGAPCPATACTVYTVTPSAGTNGTISPATALTVPPGGIATFTVTPNAGYIANVGGTCSGTLSGNTFTTNAINGSCTVVASFSQGQSYYVSNVGSNSNSCIAAKSSTTPKLTIQAGLACLTAGDSLIIRDGTYSGAANALTGLPSGAVGNYITIKAENEGNVILTSGLDMANTTAYLVFQGLRFQDANVKSVLGNHHKFFRNEFNGGCAVGNCTNTTVGTNNFNDTADILFEDNWWHGDGGRYTILVYNANRVVFRRAVIRHDGAWTDTKGDPEAAITFYNSTDCSAQNVIVLDSTLNYTTWQSAFYNVLNSASPNTNANNSWLGIIALNNFSPNFPDGAGLRFDGNAPQTGHVIQNAVLWDNYWGINVSYQSSVDIAATGLTIGQNALGSIGYGIAGGSGGTKTFINAIITNMNNVDLSGVSADYFDSFNNGNTASGTGQVSYNPRTNGLQALMRIESSTPLKTAGSGGSQIGAQVVNRIGTSGTLFSETGWNVDTGALLWPYPNEARLKKEMCTDVGITRGFCSAVSITKYIGSYLGNPSPY